MWNLEVKTYRAINQPRQGQEVIIQLCCKGLIQFKQKEQQCRIKTKKIKAKSEKDSSEIRQDIMHFFFLKQGKLYGIIWFDWQQIVEIWGNAGIIHLPTLNKLLQHR